MQTLETIKSRSQETFNNLVEKGKEQPEDVKAWGVTAGGAVVGAVAVAAVAKGVVAVLSTLASLPVALTVGAVGGGLLGWNWMKEQGQTGAADEAATPMDTSTDTSTDTPAEPAAGMSTVEAVAA